MSAVLHLLSWHDQAACRKEDPALFWPEVADPRHPEVARALAICHDRCPVRQRCLDDALANSRTHGKWGIRGGYTEQERVNLKRRLRGRAA